MELRQREDAAQPITKRGSPGIVAGQVLEPGVDLHVRWYYDGRGHVVAPGHEDVRRFFVLVGRVPQPSDTIRIQT